MAGRKKPERERTNESLRRERVKADGLVCAVRADIEKDADAVVDRARETADAILVAAREQADDRLDHHAPAAATVAAEREAEDDALRHERATADETLRREREEVARAFARILPLERAETDRHLLTERARSDEALANRDGFLGIVSHDLRNLLSGIIMSAAHLSDHAPDDEAGHRTVVGAGRIQLYAARMNRLIGDLLDVASIDAGQLALSRGRADASLAAADAAEMYQALARAKGVSLETDLDDLLYADFDHGRVIQVLGNLITNAIKFTASGGSIRVDAQRQGGEVVFTVSDTGCGIPASKLEAVFERFWQAGKNDRRGVGLGLYISRCIVEAHGGRIWADSTEGIGSRFHFTLPAAATVRREDAQPQHVG